MISTLVMECCCVDFIHKKMVNKTSHTVDIYTGRSIKTVPKTKLNIHGFQKTKLRYYPEVEEFNLLSSQFIHFLHDKLLNGYSPVPFSSYCQ